MGASPFEVGIMPGSMGIAPTCPGDLKQEAGMRISWHGMPPK